MIWTEIEEDLNLMEGLLLDIGSKHTIGIASALKRARAESNLDAVLGLCRAVSRIRIASMSSVCQQKTQPPEPGQP